MKAYSMDLRKQVAAACESGWLTQPEVAEEFGVSVSFVAKLLRREREEGTVAARPTLRSESRYCSSPADCPRMRLE